MATKKKKEAEPTIIAVKGFDKDWKCRGHQFEMGKTYKHEGEVKACSSGFHSVEFPLDVFGYYNPADSVYAEVEAFGEISRHSDDTKIASANITIKAELHIPELVTRAINWIVERCDPLKSNHSKADRSASSATGDQSASSATGDQSASSATGDQSASSATGYRSASSATGDQSASSATGDQSASSATGDRSASSATGYRSASSATGIAAVAINIGRCGKAKAGEDGAIVLVNHDDNWKIRHIRAAKVGEHGIKADTFYVLNDAGEFEEA